MNSPSIEEVSRVFCYVPRTGQLLRLVAGGGAKIGTEAGWLNGEGYRYVRINGKIYPASRVVWLLMTGRWPTGLIDHSDGCKSNNKWGNLREASHAQNAVNRHVRRSNSTGFPGVTRDGRKYYATIMKDYDLIRLGSWSTAKEANAAYNRAGKALFGKFWC